ncbi:response regulator transcription factor [Paraburkholderia antibiotica]|uniref:Response regulator transcription factor n=1 Tax=Paraburkholderia antibiotica TaxID=2728839 RepID=A0A7X9X7Y1_9BURK|nr:response regulator transcription factor [Paraburkholderia antibiotica]NML32719.1 response regulator transcription factor [Paraburkholderia antibiotica]
MSIKVVIADDHPAVLAGIRYSLDSVNTIDVIGAAQNSSEIVKLLETTSCDVLVTDYSMSDGAYGDGFSMLSYLRRRYPNIKIVTLSMHDNPTIVREVARLGVHSYLRKTDNIGHLISAIHAVYAHTIYYPSYPEIVTDLAEGSMSTSLTQLSKREAEVIRLYTSGMRVGEIAEKLNRSKKTISSQKIAAMKKLGIVSDADLFRHS